MGAAATAAAAAAAAEAMVGADDRGTRASVSILSFLSSLPYAIYGGRPAAVLR